MVKFLVAAALAPFSLFAQSAPPSDQGDAPLSVGAKFEYRVITTFGPTKIATIALYAGYDQLTNTPSEWKQGAEAYGKRYASEFGGVLARQTFAFTLESIGHQDPRYFPSKDKGFKNRMKNVIKYTFIAKSDAGRDQFAWARFGSAAGAAAVQNTWQPRSTDTAGNAMSTFAVTIAGDAAYNFLQEFIPRLRSKEFRNR
jgi:hypothetical protein